MNMADWIIPCNPGYFDIFGALECLDSIDWRQTATSIEKGDHVYIYVGSPVRAVVCRCRVMETMIPSEFVDHSDESFNLGDDLDEDFDDHIFMRLKPEKRIPQDVITLQKMRDAGLKGNIQSARRVPEELAELFGIADGCEQIQVLLDEEAYSIMPPVRNSKPCQIPIRAGRFRYLTKEFVPGTGEDGWVMFHHPGHFMIYDRDIRICIADASYGMPLLSSLEDLEDDELAAIVFEIRLLHDKDGHMEQRGWNIILKLTKDE